MTRIEQINANLARVFHAHFPHAQMINVSFDDEMTIVNVQHDPHTTHQFTCDPSSDDDYMIFTRVDDASSTVCIDFDDAYANVADDDE